MPFGKVPLQFGVERDIAQEAFFRETRGDEDKQAHFDTAAGGHEGEGAAFDRSLVGEDMVQVGQERAAAASGDGGDEPAQSAAEGGEKAFGQERQELANGIK